MALIHVSEQPNIARFEPRPPAGQSGLGEDVVWAVDEEHPQNYLLPRECPRVTFYALPASDAGDVERLMRQTSSRFVVAIESGWLPTVRATRLYVYRLPPQGFAPLDVGAGYYVCRMTVAPLEVVEVGDALAALVARDVELRVTPSPWKLRGAVVASTLQYSCIRMRNARPREG